MVDQINKNLGEPYHILATLSIKKYDLNQVFIYLLINEGRLTDEEILQGADCISTEPLILKAKLE